MKADKEKKELEAIARSYVGRAVALYRRLAESARPDERDQLLSEAARLEGFDPFSTTPNGTQA